MFTISSIVLACIAILILFFLVVVISLFAKKKSDDENKEIDSLERKYEISQAIDRAILNNDFDIVYQPIFDVDNEKMIAVEALLRLNDTQLGILLPDNFIPVAEHTGKIVELGYSVFNKVCKYISENKLYEKQISHVQINLSIIECMQEDLPDKLAEILDNYGIPKSFISLEIKESAITMKNPIITTNMEKLHEMGFSLTLDDYGTGHTTLAYVMTLPFREVKIDRSLLWNAMNSSTAMYALCANINTLKDMETKIMIQGAESEEMVDKLKQLKCDYVQGFYFATPLSENDFLDFMLKN